MMSTDRPSPNRRLSKPWPLQFTTRTLFALMTLLALFLVLLRYNQPGLIAMAGLVLIFILFFRVFDSLVLTGGLCGGVMGFVLACLIGDNGTIDILSGGLVGCILGDLVADFRARARVRHRAETLGRRFLCRLHVWSRLHVLVLCVAVGMIAFDIAIALVGFFWLPQKEVWHTIAVDCQYEFRQLSVFATTVRSVLAMWPVHALLVVSAGSSVLARLRGVDDCSCEQHLRRTAVAHSLAMLLLAILSVDWFMSSFESMGRYRPIQSLGALLEISASLPSIAALTVLTLCLLGRDLGRYWRMYGVFLIVAMAAATDAALAILGSMYWLYR